jgi:hypothetical protein
VRVSTVNARSESRIRAREFATLLLSGVSGSMCNCRSASAAAITAVGESVL